LRDSKVLIDLLKKQKEGTYALNSLVRSTGQRLTPDWLLLWFTSPLLLLCCC
jgi:hypothetical protein